MIPHPIQQYAWKNVEQFGPKNKSETYSSMKTGEASLDTTIHADVSDASIACGAMVAGNKQG